jgi:hypothetical protein
MAKAKPQGRQPAQPRVKPPDAGQRQSSTGTGQDNRKPPRGKNPKPAGQNWGGHLQGN